MESDLFTYYNERADEYDEIYRGKGPAIPHGDSYTVDVGKISKITQGFGKGNIVDIGCGSCFWLPYYVHNAQKITLIDQSARMIFKCEERIADLNIDRSKISLIQDNFFDVDFNGDTYDSALVGFFISHLRRKKEGEFFKKLNKILKPGGELLIIDSAWSEKRKPFRVKEGLQNRIVKGKNFTVYKKYFDETDIRSVFDSYAFQLGQFYFGDVFMVACGRSRKC